MRFTTITASVPGESEVRTVVDADLSSEDADAFLARCVETFPPGTFLRMVTSISVTVPE